MPNGDDADWVRVCAAIDGFRVRYGRWPTHVRLLPGALNGLRDHVLTPAGLAVVESVVQLLADPEAAMIAEDGSGASYNYGQEGFVRHPQEDRSRDWFGQAILRPDLRE